MEWDARAEERFAGLGARHALRVDHAGRAVQLGADRAYTGPDCPPDMRELGGIPQGDYAPAPFLQSSRGYALWCETYANGTRFELDEPTGVSTRGVAGPLRLHVLTDPTPVAAPAPLRAPDRPARAAAGVGLRLLEVARRLRAPGRRRGGRPRLPLARHPARRDRPRLAVGDAIQHLGAQPAPVPGLRRDGRALARDRRAHGRVGHAVGQPRVARRPDPARPGLARACTASRRPTTSREAASSAAPTASRTSRAGGWARGSMVDFTDPAAEAWWRAQAVRALRLGVEGIKADDGEGYYVGEDLRFADGTTGAQTAWRYGGLYRRSMQRALDEAHGPGRGVLFGRSGWSGQQADGHAVGGRPGVGLLVAAHARGVRASRPPAAASRTGRTTSAATSATAWSSAARRSCCCAGSQLGCFTPLMQAHGRLEQEPWTYDRETLELYRGYVLLHEMLNPYLRAAAATRGARRAADHPPAALSLLATRRLGGGRRLRVRARRSGSRRSSRRARASATPGCRRASGSRRGRARACAAAREVRGAGAAARDPGVGPRGRDRRHPPRRVRALRPRRGRRARCTRRCGASRAAGAPLARLADGTVVRWVAGAGRPHGRADMTFEER